MQATWGILEVEGAAKRKERRWSMRRLTIPKRVQLPFGYVVTIKQVTDGEMEEIVEEELATRWMGTGILTSAFYTSESPCRSDDVAISSRTNSVTPGTIGSTTRWTMGSPLTINSPV